MLFFPRRRSFLLSFSLTGILLCLVLINRNSISQQSSFATEIRKDIPQIPNEQNHNSVGVSKIDVEPNFTTKNVIFENIFKDEEKNNELINGNKAVTKIYHQEKVPNSDEASKDKLIFSDVQNDKSQEINAINIDENDHLIKKNQYLDDLQVNEDIVADGANGLPESLKENVQQIESVQDQNEVKQDFQNAIPETSSKLENVENIKERFNRESNQDNQRIEENDNINYQSSKEDAAKSDQKVVGDNSSGNDKTEDNAQGNQKTEKVYDQGEQRAEDDSQDKKTKIDNAQGDKSPEIIYQKTEEYNVRSDKIKEEAKNMKNENNENVNADGGIKIKPNIEEQKDLIYIGQEKAQNELGSISNRHLNSKDVLLFEKENKNEQFVNLKERENSVSLRKVKAVEELPLKSDNKISTNSSQTLISKSKSQNAKKIRKTGKMNSYQYYKNLYNTLIQINKNSIRRIFHQAPKDIDFIPGEKVPFRHIRRILIASTWRSGSTFLGDILQSYPATFYSFEPLHIGFRNIHLQHGENVTKALNFMKDIFACNFTIHSEYMKYLQEYEYVIQHNKFMWNACHYNQAFCYDSNFMTEICQHVPFNVMKTVRLGMVPIGELLEDKNLDIRVIHLVRDPRGSLHSRRKLNWCKSDICKDPKTVCDSLGQDLILAEKYVKKYPKRFLLLRYEDLSLDPENISKAILNFIGVHYHKSTQKFIQDHTRLQTQRSKGGKADSQTQRSKSGKADPYTTFRDSQSIPFAWRDSLTFDDVKGIQKNCRNAIAAMGLRNFNTPQEYYNKNISVFS